MSTSKADGGIRVVVKGRGVSKSGRTGKNGVVVLTVNPRTPGVLTITAKEQNRQVCGARRVGVVGVFVPPLTG